MYPRYNLIMATLVGVMDAAAAEADAERLAVLPELTDAAVALDTQARAALWAYRERHTESISAAGVPHKLDVALPAARLAAFRTELDEIIAGLGARDRVRSHRRRQPARERARPGARRRPR